MGESMKRSLGQPFARGATAEVYDWKPGLVLKLFNHGYGRGAVEHEARIALAVFDSGLPVPAAGEIVQVDGRFGLVYERVEGLPMARTVLGRPWRMLYFARRMAELQAEMHSAPFAGDLPAQRARLDARIRRSSALPDRLRDRALAALELLPEGDRLCHGDFHPENILMVGEKEIIIDWVDATRGNPLADVARTTIILRGVAEAGQGRTLIEKVFVRLFHALYLQHYFHLRPGGEEIYRAMLPVVAAARINENIGDQEAWLVAQVERMA